MDLSISNPFGHRARRGAVLLAALCTASSAWAASLYNPGLATLPSAQGWTTAGIGPYTEALNAGRYEFGTRAMNVTRAGSARARNAALDTLAGFKLDFNLRVVSEAHARADRAGFSFLVTGLDPAHSIELAFWGDHVWAYSASFMHGVDAAFDTRSVHDYALVVANNAYQLRADGAALFSGPLVDYRARGAPYNQSGFIFFGDDTSSASAQVAVGAIALQAALTSAPPPALITAPASVPEPTTTALVAAGLLSLAWRFPARRAVLASAPTRPMPQS